MDFDWLQNMLDSSTTPALTAFLLGLITAISPCPLATNIAAIGYIGKEMENRKWIFINGLLYTLGRILAYTILGIVVISILREGASIFGVQKFVAKYGEMIIGPALLLIGLYMLFGHKLRLPSFGFSGKGGEKIAKNGSWGAFLLGVLFAMAFCPSSGIFYFGMLIPMSSTATGGYFLPIIYAIATSLPVIIIAWVLAFGANQIGAVYGKIQMVQRWLNLIVGVLFVSIGVYYCIMILI